MVKIAVSCEEPSLESQVDPRFGRAAGFCIVDPDTLEYKFVDNGSSQAIAKFKAGEVDMASTPNIMGHGA